MTSRIAWHFPDREDTLGGVMACVFQQPAKILPSPMPDSTLAIHNPHDTIEQRRLEIVANLRFNHSFEMRAGYFTRSIR